MRRECKAGQRAWWTACFAGSWNAGGVTLGTQRYLVVEESPVRQAEATHRRSAAQSRAVWPISAYAAYGRPRWGPRRGGHGTAILRFASVWHPGIWKVLRRLVLSEAGGPE